MIPTPDDNGGRVTKRGWIDGVRGDVGAVGRNIARAMRRPGTYPGFAKEMLYAGMSLALYPAGVVSEALKIEQEVRFGDRFNRQVPLHYLDVEAATTPIVLLHGAFHNRSAFLIMKRSIKRYGFRHVDTMNYNVFGHGIEELAQRLHEHLFEVLYHTGSTRVHLIGHSLGGLIGRYYVQKLDGHEKVHTLVTLGTPHQGTYAALAGRSKLARQIRPGSELIEDLKQSARPLPTRFISYYSNLDPLVIPASNAKITEPALRARNVLVKDHGHLSLLTSRPLIRSIAETLSTLQEAPEASVRKMRAARAQQPNPARNEGASPA